MHFEVFLHHSKQLINKQNIKWVLGHWPDIKKPVGILCCITKPQGGKTTFSITFLEFFPNCLEEQGSGFLFLPQSQCNFELNVISWGLFPHLWDEGWVSSSEGLQGLGIMFWEGKCQPPFYCWQFLFILANASRKRIEVKMSGLFLSCNMWLWGYWKSGSLKCGEWKGCLSVKKNSPGSDQFS